MLQNRITQYLPQEQPAFAGVPAGFVLCQFAQAAAAPTLAVSTQQDIYRLAREQAERRVSRTRMERALFSVWN